MKVLIADKLSDKTVRALERLGMTVEVKADLKAEEIEANVEGVDVLVVRSTKVPANAIEKADSLSLIIRAGAGVNNIHVESAGKCGIYVANCPGKNMDAVAELAVGLMIAADRQIVNASVDLRNGKWKKKVYGKASGLKGRTLGLIGLGKIGQAVAKIAGGLEMRVLAWSRSLTPEKAEELGIDFAESPLVVARSSDVVSLHVAVTPDTKYMVNKEFLGAMKDGAVLVNTARGDVIDSNALKAAISEKNLRVAVDVFEGEPTGGKAEFSEKDFAGLITATPHIGASTDQASEAIAEEVVRIIKEFRDTGKPPNTVNLCPGDENTHTLLIRHFNRVGVLAGVLDGLRKENINVEQMENTIFKDGEAACCSLSINKKPSEAALACMNKNENILQVTLV